MKGRERQDLSPAGPPTLELHIEELVVAGLPGDRRQIAAAVQGELERLLAREGLAPALAGTAEVGVERIDGGSFRAAPGTGPRRLGREIARAVHGGLRR